MRNRYSHPMLPSHAFSASALTKAHCLRFPLADVALKSGIWASTTPASSSEAPCESQRKKAFSGSLMWSLSAAWSVKQHVEMAIKQR